LKDGLLEAETGDFDFAILDVSLHGEMSHPIADVLEASPSSRIRSWKTRFCDFLTTLSN